MTARTTAGPARDGLRRGGGGDRRGEDPSALFAALEAVYGLGRWLSWRRTERGTSNTSWFVETEAGSVVVRRSRAGKTVASAREECALMDLLRARGVPAPRVERTSGGSAVAVVDGVVHLVAHRLPGGPCDPADPTHRAVAARALGRYHVVVAELGAAWSPGASPALASTAPARQRALRTSAEATAPLLGPDGAAVRADAAHLAAQMADVHDRLAAQEELTTAVLHGSFGPTSVLVRDGVLTGVVDLDRAGRDAVGLDLAYALGAFCSDGPVRRTSTGLDAGASRAFVRDYRSRAPLPDADLRALPVLLRAQRLAKVARKCDTVLARQAAGEHGPQDAARWARVLARESARVRWLEEHAPTLLEER